MIEKDVPEVVVVVRGPRGGLMFEREADALSRGRKPVEFLAKFIRSDVGFKYDLRSAHDI